MKTKVNKSYIFWEAWRRFKASKNGTKFAWFLKKVWSEEKERVYWVNLTNNPKSSPVVQSVPCYLHGAEEYYHGEGSRGRYFGD